MSDKIYKQLPAILQTTAIRNFFENTVEQLFSKANVDQISGYVGPLGSRDYAQSSSYLPERTLDRRRYALSPTINTTNPITGDPDNVLFYDEIIDLLRNYGVPVNDHNRVFDSEHYHFLPPIDIDKFLNFQEYFWVPPVVDENTGAVTLMGPPRRVIVSNTSETSIDLDLEVRGQESYTAPDGTILSNGMLVRFTGNNMSPQSERDLDWIVEGVGSAIRLIEADRNTATEAGPVRVDSPEYLVVERGALHGSAWSRVNCWFHRDLFPSPPPRSQQARRPIIEFRHDLEMMDQADVWTGSVRVASPAGIRFENIHGKLAGFQLDTVELEQDDLIIIPFDDAVSTNIYRVIINQVNVIELVLDRVLSEGESVNASDGFDLFGAEFVRRGGGVVRTQRKTKRNQTPLFMVYDDEQNPLNSTTLYPNSAFSGSTIWEYAVGSGRRDEVLGFPLSFRPFKNSSEIEFLYTLDDDVEFAPIGNSSPRRIPGYYFFKIGTKFESAWATGQRRQTRITTVERIDTDSANKVRFDIGAIPHVDGATADIRVLVDGKVFEDWDWLTDSTVVFRDPVPVGSVIEFSTRPLSAINPFSTGRYDIPASLSKNPFNEPLRSFSRPEFIEHFGRYLQNQLGFSGEAYRENNSRDLPKLPSAADLIQQTNEDLLLSGYLLDDQPHNLVEALRFNAVEYEKYKSRVRKTLNDLYERSGFGNNTNEAILEQVLREVISFSVGRGVFEDVYVLPFGDIYQEDRFVVADVTNRDYVTSVTCNLCDIRNTSLVYHVRGNTQTLLKIDRDYEISTDSPVTVRLLPSKLSTLQIGDVISVKNYDENRDSAQCPPTPSSMGLFPIVEPRLELDTTFQEPKLVVVGHDGSRSEAYGDARDAVLIEFEQRIYNSARTEFRRRASQLELSQIDVRRGQFRETPFTLDEWNRVKNSTWSNWVIRNRLDPIVNEFYDANNPRTWNYREFGVPGHWRGAFEFIYDTDRPHLAPWECLGFTEQPVWWEEEYGTAPWTSTNILWDDIRDGIIRQGDRANLGTYEFGNPYRRIGMIVPVDANGDLLSPEIILGVPVNASADWKFGDRAPVENTWRYSSSYPFTVVESLFLLRPGLFVMLFGNPLRVTQSKSRPNRTIDRVTRVAWDWRNTEQFPIHGDMRNGNFVAAVGYTQFISSWLRFQGLSVSKDFAEPLRTLNVRLAHRLSGFVDLDTLTVRTDQYSTTGLATSLIIPVENVRAITHISPYKTRNFYSGVVIEKTTNGYRVQGYDTQSGEFQILASNLAGPRERVEVAGESEYFIDWQANRTFEAGTLVRYQNRFYRARNFISSSSSFVASLWQLLPSVPTVGGISAALYQETTGEIVQVSYQTEFERHEDVFDFLISLGRYQQLLGFDFGEFDDGAGGVRDWAYSARQFLFWAAKDWEAGNTLMLSPAAENVTFRSEFGQIARLRRNEGSQFTILNKDGRGISPNDTEILRENDEIQVRPPEGQQIYGLLIHTREIEHVMVLDNFTVFGDTLFSPLYGQKQDRIKLRGSRTAGWSGRLSSEGFIISGTELLPNLDNMAETLGRYHELGFVPVEKQVYETARSLFGYQERGYLRELDVLDDTQFEFYKGLIQNKGTSNSLRQIARSREVVRGDMRVYDEWALKVGDFGDTLNHQSIELRLIRKDFSQDPQLIQLDLPESTTGVVDEVRIIERLHRYSKPPKIRIAEPENVDGVRATANAILNSLGEIESISVVESGRGYENTPGLTVIAGEIVQDEIQTLLVADPAIGSGFIANANALANITIQDNLSSNSVVTIDLTSAEDGEDVANLINAQADINANVIATAFRSIPDGNVFHTMRIEGGDFTLGGDAGTLANLKLVSGRYQPIQRYSIDVANNTSQANITVLVDGQSVPSNLWSYDAGNTQSVIASGDTLSGNLVITYTSPISSPNAIRRDGQYPFLTLLLNDQEIFNPGFEMRWEVTSSNTIQINSVEAIGGIRTGDEITLIESATVEFDLAYQEDLPGLPLQITVETNDGIAIILGNKRTFEVTPDLRGTGITTIDIDDNTRFLKRPSGEYTTHLWATLDADSEGRLGNKYLNIPNSGYVAPGSVDYQAFDVGSMGNLWDRDLRYRPSNGDFIHVAKAENLKWNVYELSEIEANVSYVQQRPGEATTYLLTDKDLTDYLDGNRLDQSDSERYLDFYLAIKRTGISDSLVVWTKQQSVSERSVKLKNLDSSMFAMVQSPIDTIAPASNAVISITDIQPEPSAFFPATAELLGNALIQIGADTSNMRDGDTVLFYDRQDTSNLSANAYTVSNVTTAGFTIIDANVDLSVDSANLSYGYMGHTRVFANVDLTSGELVRVVADGYNGYHFADSSDTGSFVINAPYLSGGATSGTLLLSGIEITTVEDHGIPTEYRGRVAVHLSDPRYYNQLFDVTGVTSNTVYVANSFAYDENTASQNTAVLTTIDHNRLDINGHRFYLDNVNSARGMTSAFNRGIELRRGFLRDAGSLKLGFPMLDRIQDPLTGFTGNQVSGNMPYVGNLGNLDFRNIAVTSPLRIAPSIERGTGFAADITIAPLRFNELGGSDFRGLNLISGFEFEPVITPRQTQPVQPAPPTITNTGPENPRNIAGPTIPSITARPSPVIEIPRIIPTTVPNTNPSIATNPGAPVINPAPVLSLTQRTKCDDKPPLPAKPPVTGNATKTPGGTRTGWTHVSLTGSAPETRRLLVSSTSHEMKIVFDGGAAGIRVTVYQGLTQGNENTTVVNTGSARGASANVKSGSALGLSGAPDFVPLANNFVRHVGILTWKHNPARGNHYRIVMEKSVSGRQGRYEILYEGIGFNPEPRPFAFDSSPGREEPLTPVKGKNSMLSDSPVLPLPLVGDALLPESPIVKPIGLPITRDYSSEDQITSGGGRWWSPDGSSFFSFQAALDYTMNFNGFSLPPMAGLNIVPDILKTTVNTVTGGGGRFQPVSQGNVISDNMQKISGGIDIPFVETIRNFAEENRDCIIARANSLELQNEPWSRVFGVEFDAFRGQVDVSPRKISSRFDGYSFTALESLSDLARQADSIQISPTSVSTPTNIVGCPPVPLANNTLKQLDSRSAPVDPSIRFTENPIVRITPKVKVGDQYLPAGNPAFARINKPTPSVSISRNDANGVRGGDELVINGTRIILPNDPTGALNAIRDSSGNGYQVRSTIKDGEPAITVSSCSSAPITLKDGCRGGTFLEVLDFHVNTQGLSTESSNTSLAQPVSNTNISYTHFSSDGDQIGTSNTTATVGRVYSSKSIETRGSGYTVGDQLRVVGGVPVPDPFGGIASLKITNSGSGYSSEANVRVFIGDGTNAGTGARAGRVILDDQGGILNIDLEEPGTGYDATNLPKISVVDTGNGPDRPAQVSAVFSGGEAKPERVAKFVVTEIDSNGRIMDLRVTDRGIYRQFPSDLVEGIPLEYDRILTGDTGPNSSGLGVSNPGGGGQGARVFLTAREIPDCSERGDARRTMGLPTEVSSVSVPESLADDLNNALLLAGYNPDDIRFDVERVNDDISMLTLNAPGFDGVEIDEDTPGFLVKLGIPTGDYNPDTLLLAAELETQEDDDNPEIGTSGDFVDENGFRINVDFPAEIISFPGADVVDISNFNDPNGNANTASTGDLFQYELRTPRGDAVSLDQNSQNAQVLYFESRRYPTLPPVVPSRAWVDDQDGGWAYLENGAVVSRAEPLVDTRRLQGAILYDEVTGTKTLDIQPWDPFKGILPGFIRREIHVISGTDPVAYRSTRSNFGSKDVGKIWWDTSTVAYQWYEQGTARSRAANWGAAFPGSSISLYEWVESTRVPAEYLGTGTPRSLNQFVTERRFDPPSSTYQNFYYFWVNNTTEISAQSRERFGRRFNTLELSRLLSDPRGMGIPLIGYSSDSSFVLTNVSKDLREADDILQIDFSRNESSQSDAHTAFKLMREGDRRVGVPEDLSLKLIDSLAGANSLGQPVPDPTLSRIEALGVNFRPRQSMFKDVREARRVMVSLVNTILADIRFSAVVSGWRNIKPSPSRYVETRTWFALIPNGEGERYDASFKPVYRVNSAGELRTLGRVPDGSVAQVRARRGDQAQLWIYNASINKFSLIAVEEDTLAFTDATWEDDTNPSLSDSIRSVLTLIRTILGNDSEAWVRIFFEMVKYAFAEQKQLSWAFKTSYLYIEKDEEDLIEFSGFRADNFENVLSYLNEAKGYTAKVREYRDGKRAPLEMLGTNALSDYDKPPYPDVRGRVRILNLDTDETILSTDPQYRDWYNAITDANLLVESSEGWDISAWDTTNWDGRILISFFESVENPIRTMATTIHFDRTGWQLLGVDWDASSGLIPGMAERISLLNQIRENRTAWTPNNVRAVDRVFMFTPLVRQLFEYELERFAGNATLQTQTNTTILGAAIMVGALSGTLELVKQLAQGGFRGREIDGGLFTQNADKFDPLEVYQALGFDSFPWDSGDFDLIIAIENYEATFGDFSNFVENDETIDGFDAVGFKKLLGEERPEELALYEPLENLIISVKTNDVALDNEGNVIASLSGNTTPVEYRFHYSVDGETELYRVLPNIETELSVKLNPWDSEVTVANPSVLTIPDEDSTGRAWIGGELIEYRSKSGNRLLRVTRGVGGTTITEHPSGTRVFSASSRDAAKSQGLDFSWASWLIPNTTQESIAQQDQTDSSPRGLIQKFLRGET